MWAHFVWLTLGAVAKAMLPNREHNSRLVGSEYNIISVLRPLNGSVYIVGCVDVASVLFTRIMRVRRWVTWERFNHTDTDFFIDFHPHNIYALPESGILPWINRLSLE